MSSVTRALYDYLIGQSTVTDLVGTRIYQEMAPAGGELPRVTFTLVSESYVETMSGATSDLSWSNFQIDTWAATPDAARALGEALRLVLQGFRGAMGSEAVDVRHCTVRGRQVLFSEPDSADDIAVYRITQEVRIIAVQPVPALP